MRHCDGEKWIVHARLIVEVEYYEVYKILKRVGSPWAHWVVCFGDIQLSMLSILLQFCIVSGPVLWTSCFTINVFY